MAILYGRRLTVEVAGLTIEDLRIAVKIERELDKTQDKGEVAIWNLSDAHAERIWKRGGPIQIVAGYPETAAILFDGEAQRVRRAREGLAFITRIALGDFVRDVNRLGGCYDASFAGVVPVRRIATDIIERGLGLAVGPLDAIPEAATFTNWYWGGQSAAAALTRLLDAVGCVWFEEDRIVRVNRVGMLQSDAPTIRVTPETGLIGRVAETDEGRECRMFLNPAVRLGGVLDIESAAFSGRMKVAAIRHNADNRDGKFETVAELRELQDA